MQSLFQKYRHALWFLLFGALSVFYFVSQHLGLRYHVVHLPLDDWLPFWPGFIVFYVLWYFYVPGCMLWAVSGPGMCFTGRWRRCFRVRLSVRPCLCFIRRVWIFARAQRGPAWLVRCAA